MNKLLLPLFFVISLSLSRDQGFSFYDGPLLFKPLTANSFEPRVGLIWHANNNRLRLDIGNSVDLVQYEFDERKALVTIGTDFFTYTLLRGEKNFHFPVDAVDYLFGFNINYKDTLASGILSSRLRLSHISAHFVDGHFDGTTGTWKDAQTPRVYSREFFEFTLALEPNDFLRGYTGITYLWHVDPTTLPQWIGYLGGEVHYEVLSATYLFGAYQFTATGLLPRHEIEIGAKVGQWNGRGTELFFAYHRGNSIHGEYYDQLDEYSGIGFNINF